MELPSRNLCAVTDVALLLRQGSTLAEREAYWTLTTPANPTYHWGNCIILRETPKPGSLAQWRDIFETEHPSAAHVAIAVDERDTTVDPEEAAAVGLDVEQDVVLTAKAVAEQERPPTVECRLFDLADDELWQRAVDLDVANQPGGASDSYRSYVQRSLDGLRALQREGTGGWFGAFDAQGVLLGNLGIYSAGKGYARYQSVLTDAAHRGQGIAGALVRAAGRWALTHLGARTIVIVADATGPAIGVYRAAGLHDLHALTTLYTAGSEPAPEPDGSDAGTSTRR